ncbi:tripartite tricarboxylate transporter TctB family protein [Microbacterium sp. NPDC089318]
MTSTARTARAASTATLAVLGVVAAIIGASYGVLQDNGQIGAGFLPVALGVILALLAIIDLAQTRIRRDADVDALAPELERDTGSDVDSLGRSQRQRNRMLVLVVGMLFIDLLLVPFTGLLIALGLLVVGIATIVERRHILYALIVGAVSITVVHLVFAVLLKVPMPTGLIGLI